MISVVQLGLICSALRIAAVASVVMTAFLRLDSKGFVAFSQFHVALSMASFIECLVVVERSKLYDAGAAGLAERSSLLRWARRLGVCSLVIGASVYTISIYAVPLFVGAGIAILAIPESAALREMPNRSAKLELIALTTALLVLAGSWLLPSLDTTIAVAILALMAVTPRLMLAIVMRIPDCDSNWRHAQCAVLRNLRSIAPFAINQAALPWLFAVPNLAVPAYLPERESSWVLLGLRASGAVASMLARTLVQRWIQLTDGHKISAVPRLPFIALGLAFVLVLGGSMLDLEPSATAIALTTFLAIGCAVQAFLSTHMNAHGHYLKQLPAFALFWLPGSGALALAAGTSWTSPSLQLFANVQSAGVLLAVVMMTMLSVDHSSVRSASSRNR